MKNRIGILSAAIILIATIAFLAVDAGFFLYNPDRLSLQTPYCTLDIIRGDIRVMTKDSLTWEEARDGMSLEPGSRIKTSAGAGAALAFNRGTTTKLEPGTDLVVDKIEDSRDNRPYTVVLKQQSGKTWNQVDRNGGNTSFRIRTASAEVSVHGTLFSTEVDETGKTIVQTAEGSVGVSAGGEEVRVLAGLMTEVRPDEKPAAPVAIPRAENELVITVSNPASGLVKNPGGASIGYLDGGAKVNQIPGSTVSAGGDAGQTIRLREPETGDYLLTLRGAADGIGLVSVEGFVEGESAFLYVESYNITAAQETLLKLHYDVIDGLLHQVDQASPEENAALVSLQSDEPASTDGPAAEPPAPAAARPTATGATESPDEGFTWFEDDSNGLIGRLISAASLLFVVIILFIFIRKKN